METVPWDRSWLASRSGPVVLVGLRDNFYHSGGPLMADFDLISALMAWEDGTLSSEDELVLFQGLVNSGLAWQLQGCYGRRARELIETGDVI